MTSNTNLLLRSKGFALTFLSISILGLGLWTYNVQRTPRFTIEYDDLDVKDIESSQHFQ
jgi:hypothetical protein